MFLAQTGFTLSPEAKKVVNTRVPKVTERTASELIQQIS